MNDRKCEDRIDAMLRSRLDDLSKMEKGEIGGDYEDFASYGLAFDYVPSGTFDDQREGFFRYQISWGGPSDEFRFFTDDALNCVRIEYWFLDWFDGANRDCTKEAIAILLWQWFKDAGDVRRALKAATG